MTCKMTLIEFYIYGTISIFLIHCEANLRKKGLLKLKSKKSSRSNVAGIDYFQKQIIMKATSIQAAKQKYHARKFVYSLKKS